MRAGSSAGAPYLAGHGRESLLAASRRSRGRIFDALVAAPSRPLALHVAAPSRSEPVAVRSSGPPGRGHRRHPALVRLGGSWASACWVLGMGCCTAAGGGCGVCPAVDNRNSARGVFAAARFEHRCRGVIVTVIAFSAKPLSWNAVDGPGWPVRIGATGQCGQFEPS